MPVHIPDLASEWHHTFAVNAFPATVDGEARRDELVAAIADFVKAGVALGLRHITVTTKVEPGGDGGRGLLAYEVTLEPVDLRGQPLVAAWPA